MVMSITNVVRNSNICKSQEEKKHLAPKKKKKKSGPDLIKVDLPELIHDWILI